MLDHPHIIKLYQVSCEYYLYVVYLYFFSLAACGWVGTFVVKGRRLTWHVHSQMCTTSSSLAAVFDSQRQLNMKLPEILFCSQFDWEASTKLWGKRMTTILFSYSSWQLAWKKTQYVYTHRLLAGKTRLASYRLCFSSARVTSCFFRYRHGFRPFGICMEAKSLGKISSLYNRAYNVTDLTWNKHLMLLVSCKIPPPPNDPWQIL